MKVKNCDIIYTLFIVNCNETNYLMEGGNVINMTESGIAAVKAN